MDISETAIKKAKAKYPDIEFEVGTAENLEGEEKFDLVILMEILSYLKKWKEVIKKVAQITTNYIYITLFTFKSYWFCKNTRGVKKRGVQVF